MMVGTCTWDGQDNVFATCASHDCAAMVDGQDIFDMHITCAAMVRACACGAQAVMVRTCESVYVLKNGRQPPCSSSRPSP